MSNLSRKLTANLDFRERKQAFWRWWSGEPRRKIKPPVIILRRRVRDDQGNRLVPRAYQFFRKTGATWQRVR